MAFYRSHILVCSDMSCMAEESAAIQAALINEMKLKGLAGKIKIIETGQMGNSNNAPMMIVYPEGVVYHPLTEADIPEIVEEHLVQGRIIDRLLYRPSASDEATSRPGAAREERVILRNVGLIDPRSIVDYIAVGGYQALRLALTQMTPDQVIDTIKASGLRERDSDAFPTGLKWGVVRGTASDEKHLICTTEIGEPGNFKDRAILEGDPHTIVEAMIIAGYAIGDTEGYFYIRDANYQSLELLELAITNARDAGLLGTDIFGSGFDFDISIFKGSGGYVCSQDTALIESIEGRRAEVRTEPPFAYTSGLWGKPTAIDTVETLASVPQIILNGPKWFNAIGTEKSFGTKLYSTCGDVLHPGVYEVPFGATLREVIYGLAGGTRSGRQFKAAIVGGPTGVCVGKESLDRSFSYEDLSPGTGGLTVIDEDKCIVDLVHSIVKFLANESCGQCVPCREGTKRMVEILDTCIAGNGSSEDIDLLTELSNNLALTSKCKLGQSAGNAFLSSLDLFESEYRAHVGEGKCPTKRCILCGGTSENG